jgi:hypothetical protein
MASIVACPSCGVQLTVTSVFSGQTIMCPKCGKSFAWMSSSVPGDSDRPPRTSRMAIASLTLGIPMCLGPFTGIPALILGVVALRRIKASGGAQKGGGLAVAGISLGAISIFVGLFVGVMAVLLLPALSSAREHARRAACSANMDQIGKAIEMYLGTSNDYYPCDSRGPLYSLSLLYPAYVPDARVFKCPSCEDGPRFPPGSSLAGYVCSYGYTQPVTPRKLGNGPLVMDSPGNHGKGGNVLRGDYSLEWTDDLEKVPVKLDLGGIER